MTEEAAPDMDEFCAGSRFVIEQANTPAESRLAKRAPCVASRAEAFVILEVVGASLARPHP
jgi:hypothetical protein